jgi:hypothetical protein
MNRWHKLPIRYYRFLQLCGNAIVHEIVNQSNHHLFGGIALVCPRHLINCVFQLCTSDRDLHQIYRIVMIFFKKTIYGVSWC